MSDNEYNEYQNKNFKKIVRIFYEFISTTLDPNICMNFFDKGNPEIKQIFWEIKIPSEILKNHPHCIADTTDFSMFSCESELILTLKARILF